MNEVITHNNGRDLLVFDDPKEFAEWLGLDPRAGTTLLAVMKERNGDDGQIIKVYANGLFAVAHDVALDMRDAPDWQAWLQRTVVPRFHAEERAKARAAHEALAAERDARRAQQLAPVAEEMRRAALAERERRRRARAEARPEPTSVTGGSKCSECGKKEARVDDLCKRCAHAAGTLVRGKIGSAP